MEMRIALTAGHNSILGKIALCALLATATLAARAQSGECCIGVNKGQAHAIEAGVVGGGAALVGIVIYFAVRHGHSLRGCAVTGPNGLQLRNQGDEQTYTLTGKVAAIKPGDRVRVSGRKGKKSAGVPRDFLVAKLTKDYGACQELPAAAHTPAGSTVTTTVVSRSDSTKSSTAIVTLQ